MIIWSCTIVLSFFVYSFLGWLWESTVCSLYNEKQLINRGFLVGPLCPIYGALAFGIGCFSVRFFVQPALFRLFSYMEPRGLFVVSVVFFVLFITDLLLTIANWKQLNKHLATIHAYLNGSANQIMENFSEKIPESLISDENGIRVKIRRVSVLLQKRELRFFGAFPKLKIYAYDKTIKKLQLKERWSEFRERKLKR